MSKPEWSALFALARGICVICSLRLTSSAIPAELFSFTYLRAGIGGTQNWDLSFRRRRLYQLSYAGQAEWLNQKNREFHKTNTLQTRLIYRHRRKMILLLFSILSAILALIVRPAIQSLSWIISLNPYSFSKSNLLLLFFLFFMKTSDTHFASLWLKKCYNISFSRKTDQDHKID